MNFWRYKTKGLMKRPYQMPSFIEIREMVSPQMPVQWPPGGGSGSLRLQGFRGRNSSGKGPAHTN